MTNRAERRRAVRAEVAAFRSKVGEEPLPPICEPGRHAFGRVSATYRGVEVAVRVVCNRCRRLIEQVLREQPETFEAYTAWVATERETEYVEDVMGRRYAIPPAEPEKLDAAHQAQIQPAHYRR